MDVDEITETIRMSGYCVAAVMFAIQFGCAVKIPESVSSASPAAKMRNASQSPPMSTKSTGTMMGMMDTTMGSDGTGREANLILVTVEMAVHREMKGGETELSDPYLEFLTRLEQRYGLLQVADWPLETIGVK